MEIKNTKAGVQQDKRFYFPTKIKDKCPICGHGIEKDFSTGEYLSYPVTNKPFFFDFYCEECGHEWTSLRKIVLRITLEEV
jgi:ribosomal protein S14